MIDRAVGQLGLVDGLELADRGGLAVRLVGRLVGELEEVHEPGGVVLCHAVYIRLPGSFRRLRTNSVIAAVTLVTARFTW